MSYDELSDAEQAAVRVAWEEAIKAAIRDLDYERDLIAEGASWAEADELGQLVWRPSDTYTPSNGCH